MTWSWSGRTCHTCGIRSLPARPHPRPFTRSFIRFLDTFLGGDFLEIPEAQPLCRLLRRARRGLLVQGAARDQVAAGLEELPNAAGLERVGRLLGILSLLARSPDLTLIASPGFIPDLSGGDQHRVGRVIQFIHDHLTEPFDRAAVAAEAHLSVGAFSRFFKLRTGKTLPEYVNELRVGRACRLLAEGDLKVTDVALQCGFNNLANFNRRFQSIRGLTPSAYREQVRRSAR